MDECNVTAALTISYGDIEIENVLHVYFMEGEGYIFTLLWRIGPYLAGIHIRSQGCMTTYANDIITHRKVI